MLQVKGCHPLMLYMTLWTRRLYDHEIWQMHWIGLSKV